MGRQSSGRSTSRGMRSTGMRSPQSAKGTRRPLLIIDGDSFAHRSPPSSELRPGAHLELVTLGGTVLEDAEREGHRVGCEESVPWRMEQEERCHTAPGDRRLRRI
jgi:hypothetical protein